MAGYKLVQWAKDSSSFKILDLRYESVARSSSSGSASIDVSHVDRYYFVGSAREIQQRAREEIRLAAAASLASSAKAKKAGSVVSEFDTLKDVVSFDAELFQEDQRDEETFEEFLSKRTKFFNEQTRGDRSNIKIWQDYVAFQDQFAHVGSTRAMILEQKIEIFKTAIEANPHADELVLGMLNACQQLYSVDKTQKIWQETIARNPDSALLWSSYLAFVQSNFSSFTISLLRTIYIAAIKALNRQKRLCVGQDSIKFAVT